MGKDCARGSLYRPLTAAGRANGGVECRQAASRASRTRPRATHLDDRLGDPDYPESQTEHWIDSERVPFSVLPGKHSFGCKLGDVGVAYNVTTTDSMFFTYADIGPSDKIGDGLGGPGRVTWLLLGLSPAALTAVTW